MPNVTIALSDQLLAAGRDYAHRHGISLNALIRELLERKVNAPPKSDFLQAFFDAVDKAHGDSRGWKWNRGEIYEREDKK